MILPVFKIVSMENLQTRRDSGINVRNIHFEGLEAAPAYWHPAGRSVSLFINAMSAMFPDGERFFVRSVRAQLSRITDEELLKAARAFCAQEALHGREHDAFNRALEEGGFPVAAMARGIRAAMEQYEKMLSPTGRLAATSALEHVTAMLAHMMLTNPDVLAGPEPVVRMLRWHAAEELEHKAVAMDVFRAAGGSEAERIAVYAMMMTAFVVQMSRVQYRLMRGAGMHKDLREWARFGRFLFARDRVPTLIPMALDYLRPGFHPWDQDDNALLEAWKAQESLSSGLSAAAA